MVSHGGVPPWLSPPRGPRSRAKPRCRPRGSRATRVSTNGAHAHRRRGVRQLRVLPRLYPRAAAQNGPTSLPASCATAMPTTWTWEGSGSIRNFRASAEIRRASSTARACYAPAPACRALPERQVRFSAERSLSSISHAWSSVWKAECRMRNGSVHDRMRFATSPAL